MPDFLERLRSALGDRYAIEREIGRGGMATVYLAEDLKHHRHVAIKVLHPELGAAVGSDRFLREIETVAGLRHPHILPLHDSGEADGLLYFVMPYVEGESLRQRLERDKQLPIDEAIRIAREVADALDHAHRHEVLHRDIKPANILLDEGHAVVTDFGIARAVSAAGEEKVTATGLAVGTPAYMSPEQATAQETLDGRTDIYSLGCVLYEMLAGEPPLTGSTSQMIQARRLSETPTALHALRDTVPPALDNVIARSLARIPADRWDTAEQFGQALMRGLVASTPSVGADLGFTQPALSTDPGAAAPVRRRPVTRRMMAAAILGVGVVGAWVLVQRVAPATGETDETAQVVTGLDEIRRLTEEWDFPSAYAIARELDGGITDDSVRASIWAEVSRPVTFRTEPPGALVLRRDYAPAGALWEELGHTPLEVDRFPFGLSRVRFELEGYLPRETARGSGDLAGAPPFKLDTEETLPAGMTRVGGRSASIWAPGLEQLNSLALGDFFIARHEVTNREYKAFLDGGGYRDSACWNHTFVRDGRTLSFDEAVAELTDQTGRPGPSTWEVGSYPEGADDLPVGGVSWYEAEAFACFAGMDLPTVYHWYMAADPFSSNYVVPLSNYDAEGPAAGGKYEGVTRDGVYDMAGNVREWTRNADSETRFILGGGWSDPEYSFNDAMTFPAFDRSPSNGIRLAQYSDTTNLTAASAPIERMLRDYRTESPVSDDVFKVYRQMYAYDATPLNAAVLSSDTTATWIRERIEMDAAYGGERLTAFLFLPPSGAAPFQTVVLFPGSEPIYRRSYDNLSFRWASFVLLSGRALIVPIYKGTYERGTDLESDIQDETNLYRDHVIAWSQDLGRSIDYLETRPDIDADRLAYFGGSWGGMMGGIMTAVEPRFKASVLVSGGLAMQATQPMADPFNFLPRVTVPTLMLNGRYDSLYPVESSQMPFFENLGTLEQDKKIIITDANHYVLGYEANLVIRETLDWYDRYLGLVE